jgi:hypothetical protein
LDSVILTLWWLQASQFEAFAADFFESQGHGNIGMSHFGRGIYGLNSTGGVYHDTGAPKHGTHNIMIPNLLPSNIIENHMAVMLNIYSQNTSYWAIDSLLDCFEMNLQDECFAFSDVMRLIQDATGTKIRPAVSFYSGLNINGTTVALLYAVSNFDSILANSVPHYIHGLEVVIHVKDPALSNIGTSLYRDSGIESGVYHFKLISGKAEFQGQSEHIDHFEDGHFLDFGFPDDSIYSFSLRKTPAFENQFRTKSPIYASLFSSGVVLLTSMIFFWYDHWTARRAQQKDVVIETRRLFVRCLH